MNEPLPDPTTAARDWLAANPDHDLAVHVREALASSDRHEALAEAVAVAPPGGTYVLLITEDGRRLPIFTAVGRIDEQEIAKVYLRHVLATEIDQFRESGAMYASAMEKAYRAAGRLEAQLARLTGTT